MPVFLVYAAARRGWQSARGGRDGSSVAGIAVFTAIIVITVLMTFDPHLTYRGAGDAFFAMLALAVPRAVQAGRAQQPPMAGRAMPADLAPRAGDFGEEHRAPELAAVGGRAPGGSGNGQESPVLLREVRT